MGEKIIKKPPSESPSASANTLYKKLKNETPNLRSPTRNKFSNSSNPGWQRLCWLRCSIFLRRKCGGFRVFSARLHGAAAPQPVRQTVFGAPVFNPTQGSMSRSMWLRRICTSKMAACHWVGGFVAFLGQFLSRFWVILFLCGWEKIHREWPL